MKLPSYTLAFLLAFAAVAGCADNTGDAQGTPTTTPTATPSVTPSASPTPVVTPTENNTDDDEGMPTFTPCTGNYTTTTAPGTRLGMPELNFTIQEPSDDDPCYAFVGPATAQSGWNVFSLSHPGREFHIMPMYFIGTHTLDEFTTALAGDDAPPAWVVPAGAVGAVTGGQNGSVALDLQVGTYAYFCPIGGHMFRGMMGTINVTEAETPAPEPTADVTVSLVDYNFTLPTENLTATTKIIKVVNNGMEPHEAPLARLNANTTVMEFLHAVEDPNATSPPPGQLIGGVNAIAPGQTAYLLVDLEEGVTYGMACFVSSPTHGGKPHLELGMSAEFTIA